MKFIHAADIHLDSPLCGLVRYEGINLPHGQTATRAAFVNLVNFACQEKVDFIVFAGDLYDGDWKDYNTGLFFNQQMARLKEDSIKAFIVYGNHDAVNIMTKKLTLPDNVIVFSSEQPQTHILEHLGVAIHGQSFATRAVKDNLSINYPVAIPNLYNIGLLHTSLDGREGHDNYAPAQLADLLAKNYDYWALGHVHKHEIIHKSPYIVFSGNLQGRHVRESGSKGCTLVTVNDGQTRIEQYSLDVLRWGICNINASNIKHSDDLIDSVQQALTYNIEQEQDKILALRFNIYGQTPIHNELHRYPEKWLQEIRNIANDVGNIWVEKVKFATSEHEAAITMGGQLNGDGTALGELLHTLRNLPEDNEMLGCLAIELAQLYKSLPPEVNRIDPNNQDDLLAELKQVEDILLARLLTNY